MYFYQVFALTIQSEIYFPELMETLPSNRPDVTISIDKLAFLENEKSPVGILYQAKPNFFTLHVPAIARFCVKDGAQIRVNPVDGIDEDSLRYFILGPCMVALLIQRDLFLLHASTMKIRDKCVSFAGGHGFGKSTLSAALLTRGYSLLSDDICAINSKGEVLASFPQIDLWQESLLKLQIHAGSLRKIRPCIDKFALPVGTEFYSSCLPLETLYILNPHNQNEFTHLRLRGSDKIKYLHRFIYNKMFVCGFKKDFIYFEQCSRLAQQLEIILINRPMLGFQLETLVQFVENVHELQYANE